MPEVTSCSLMDRGGEESISSSPVAKPFHRVFLRGRRRSPTKKVSGMRKLRSSFQHSQVTSSSSFSMLTFHNSSSQSSSSQDSSANELGWLSIDGLLVNEFEATSSRTIGSLDNREAAVWNRFAPLLVAITAAAATAAKQQCSKDLERLHLAIDSRNKELASMHKRIECLQEHLSFWKEHARPLCGDVECVEASDRLYSDRLSPHFKLEVESTPKCESRILEQYATPHLMKGLKGRPGSRRALGGERWSMVTLENASGSKESLEHPADYTLYSDKSTAFCTPQLPRALLNNCLTPVLPFTIPIKHQDGQYHLGNQKVCARVNLGSECTVPSTTPMSPMEIQVQQLLHTEVPDLMEALSVVMEKAQEVATVDTMSWKMPTESLCSLRQPAIAELRTTVKQASAKIKSLLSTWHIVKEMMTNMDALLQPEVDDCFDVLARDMEVQMMRQDFFGKSSDAEERRMSGMSDWSIDTSLSDASCTENDTEAQKDVASALKFAVKKTVDNLMDNDSGMFQDGSSPEVVIEMLLVELENAAAKVADMEMQMRTLREKKEEAELRVSKLELVPIKQEGGCLKSNQLACAESVFNKKEVQLLKDACRQKDHTIAKLEEEIAVLQARIREFKVAQTPQVQKEEDWHSPPTFLMSNLLFNLDSPVKLDSPTSENTTTPLWRQFDHLTAGGHSSLEARCAFGNEEQGPWRKGLQQRSEEHCETTAASTLTTTPTTNNTLRTSPATINTSAFKVDKSTNCARSVRNSTKEIGHSAAHHSKPKTRNTHPHHLHHARRLKFPGVDPRLSEGNHRGPWSADDPHRIGRQDASITPSGCNILVGVEPNTPIFNSRRLKTKEKGLSRSVDSLNKAKENFFQRPRWM